jgi:hypothetical protein
LAESNSIAGRACCARISDIFNAEILDRQALAAMKIRIRRASASEK